MRRPRYSKDSAADRAAAHKARAAATKLHPKAADLNPQKPSKGDSAAMVCVLEFQLKTAVLETSSLTADAVLSGIVDMPDAAADPV